jgi:hypothetical protein
VYGKHPTAKSKKLKHILLDDITEVVAGFDHSTSFNNTLNFYTAKRRRKKLAAFLAMEHRAFSIVTRDRTLDIIARSAALCV